MLRDERLDVHPIYVQATDKTRLIRALKREENPDCAEICRRYMTDEEDFQNIPFEYKVFNNININIINIYLVHLNNTFSFLHLLV